MLNDLNKLNNLADKAISDDELENVSGGALTFPKYCTPCQYLFYWDGAGVCTCPKCGAPC